MNIAYNKVSDFFMISTIVVTGFLDEIYAERFRKLKTTNTNISIWPCEEVVSFLPLLYWTRDANNPLNNYEKGQFVIVQGHLEANEEIGLYILVETFRIAKF